MSDFLVWLSPAAIHSGFSDLIRDTFLVVGVILLVPTLAAVGLMFPPHDHDPYPWTFYRDEAMMFGFIALGSIIPGWIGVVLFTLGIVVTVHRIVREKREATE